MSRSADTVLLEVRVTVAGASIGAGAASSELVKRSSAAGRAAVSKVAVAPEKWQAPGPSILPDACTKSPVTVRVWLAAMAMAASLVIVSLPWEIVVA